MSAKLHSIAPADVIERASVVWGHTHLVICPTCRKPAMVGYLDHRVYGYACQKCGPINPPSPPETGTNRNQRPPSP